MFVLYELPRFWNTNSTGGFHRLCEEVFDPPNFVSKRRKRRHLVSLEDLDDQLDIEFSLDWFDCNMYLCFKCSIII